MGVKEYQYPLKKKWHNGKFAFPDEIFEDFQKFEKVKGLGFEKFASTLDEMRALSVDDKWIKNSDIVLKFVDNKALKETWIEVHNALNLESNFKCKYPDFETLEILTKIHHDPRIKYSFKNMHKTFTEDMADDICKIIKTQGLEPRDWNVLLGNFDEVITFKDIKNY